MRIFKLTFLLLTISMILSAVDVGECKVKDVLKNIGRTIVKVVALWVLSITFTMARFKLILPSLFRALKALKKKKSISVSHENSAIDAPDVKCR
ncbi:unnamed protein product [Cylicocyclus nassatus]|uniref:Uncharacterized protein n=1 Tax=Cylicocyclus nassatus TaxID=53992 RepID=A0AA36GM44_CYLNA|nr:unnamed protein product [Cylicocyclus nassatus]